MRLLADACVANSLVQALRADGHDVVFAAEGPPLVPDQEILEQARGDGRILLTEDYDFGALIIRDGEPAPGVILIELHGLGTAAKNRRVLRALVAGEATFANMFTVLEPGRTRSRPMRAEP